VKKEIRVEAKEKTFHSARLIDLFIGPGGTGTTRFIPFNSATEVLQFLRMALGDHRTCSACRPRANGYAVKKILVVDLFTHPLTICERSRRRHSAQLAEGISAPCAQYKKSSPAVRETLGNWGKRTVLWCAHHLSLPNQAQASRESAGSIRVDFNLLWERGHGGKSP
jgi:hypothetical protein